MAVAFDNSTSATGLNITSLTPPAFTISSAANLACLTNIYSDTGTMGTITTTLGGVNGAPITGTSVQTSGAAAPPSGSQSCAFTWTGSSQVHVACGVATYTGADQTTPFNNGTSKVYIAPDTVTIQITSN